MNGTFVQAAASQPRSIDEVVDAEAKRLLAGIELTPEQARHAREIILAALRPPSDAVLPWSMMLEVRARRDAELETLFDSERDRERFRRNALAVRTELVTTIEAALRQEEVRGS